MVEVRGVAMESLPSLSWMPYVGLCVDCYKTLVVSKVGPVRSVIWRIKRLMGNEDAA